MSTDPPGPRRTDRGAPGISGEPLDKAPQPDTVSKPAARSSSRADATTSRPEKAEFTAFYRESAPQLVAFLRWQGASLPDAAECAQEALVACYQRWSRIEHHYAWCRLVASRLYVRRVASVEELVDDVEASGRSPLIRSSREIEWFENLHTVLRLIDCLPPRERQVLAWTYDGAEDTEIAAALQITVQAVRSSRLKARAALRHLKNGGGEQA